MAEPRARGWLVVLLASLSALVLSACDVRAELVVTVDEDGSGTIALAVGIDAATAAAHPGLVDGIVVDDLEERGWVIEGPELGPDGGGVPRQWLRATRHYGSEAELRSQVAELFGADGPVSRPSIERRDGFDHSVHRVSVRVEPPGDPALLAADPLVAEILGVEPEALLSDVVGPAEGWDVAIEVVLVVPEPARGQVETNGAVDADGSARWHVHGSDAGARELWVEGTIHHRDRTRWAVAAGAATAVAVVALGVGLAGALRRRRDRHGPGRGSGRPG